jgi:hypothetical protein
MLDNDSLVVDIRFPTWIFVGIEVCAGFSLKERAYVRFAW